MNGRQCWWLCIGWLCVCQPAWGEEKKGKSVEVCRDFEKETLGVKDSIKHHTWSAEQQAEAGKFSRVEVIEDKSFGKQCAKLMIEQTFPWQRRTTYRALTIGSDYLPPEADAVRIQVKVLKGEFQLAVGSPTVYFGHSDVQSETIRVSPGEWTTVEFSLHDQLTRNFRRARFGAKSPVIYYSRWIQEPLYLYVVQPSHGEILLDQVELITHGRGRSYPTFAEEQIRQVATVADFEQPTDMAKAFTFFQDPIDFSKPPYLPRNYWTPPQLQRVEQGDKGKFSLKFEQRGMEETCFAGVKALGSAESNALALRIKAEHDSDLKDVALDFIVYVAPTEQRTQFPWSQFEPPAVWKQKPEVAFTYYLAQEQTRTAHYGFYHVRRTVPNHAWSTLVLPYADFICAYGQLDCEAMFQKQLPLQGETIMALGLLSPYGQRRSVTTVFLDDLTFVHIPGSTASHQSFYQQRPAKQE